ncbi:MAG: alpha/beta hydrolase [Ichthyobacteriaceae bacterium]|nr:alpha/beta hydrolase [Ichthyobacteriaceae bacterium]
MEEFWGHNFYVENNIEYTENANEFQQLDLYLQGEYVGEPLYIKTKLEVVKTFVFFHGGGWSVGDKAKSINYFLHFIQKGWQVISVNYTLANEGENVNVIPKAVADAMLAYKWIETNSDKYNIDLNNIIVGGESAGGQLAMISAMKNLLITDSSIKIKSVVNWFGVMDIEKFFLHIMDVHFNKTYTDKEKAELVDISKKYSPTNFVTKNTPPVITIHGNNDTVVLVNQANNFHAKLSSLKVDNKLIVPEFGKHAGFSSKQWKNAFNEIFNFLKF